MSEKRFIRNIVGDIYDSEKGKWFEEDWKGKPLDYDDDLIVFLNEQQDTIDEQKIAIDDLKTIIGYLLEDMLYSEKFLDYLVENGDYTREEIDKTKRDQTMIIKLILKHGLLKPEEINDDFKSFL